MYTRSEIGVATQRIYISSSAHTVFSKSPTLLDLSMSLTLLLSAPPFSFDPVSHFLPHQRRRMYSLHNNHLEREGTLRTKERIVIIFTATHSRDKANT